MQKIYIMIAFLALGAFTISSCGKKGCTDANATNHQSDAKRDDGSCLYEGKIVFWLNQATEEELYAKGYFTDDLHFIVDGKQIENEWGEKSFDFESSAVAPDCPSSSFWSWDFSSNPGATLDLGSSTSKNVTYRVIDENETEIFSGSKAVQANACNDVQLKF